MKEARRRQARRGQEERPGVSFRQLHRQEVKEARRRQIRRKLGVHPEPDFRRPEEPQEEQIYYDRRDDG